jgi:DNA-binding response OmpR family regulator
MPQRQKILVVDDDLRLRDLLKRYLSEQGFAVDTVPDAQSMDRSLQRVRYDLLVLDLMLPGEDGLAICRRLRAAADPVAVIMLTAKGDDVDRILGLEMGADDYLAKPFHPRELLARIRAILARAEPRDGEAEVAEYRFEGFRLDLVHRTLTRSDGERVPLSGAELELLRIFLTRPNQVLARDLLVELTQGRAAPAYDRSIDVRVSRLRSALGDKRAARLLQTVYGEGYVLAAKVEAVAAVAERRAAQGGR